MHEQYRHARLAHYGLGVASRNEAPQATPSMRPHCDQIGAQLARFRENHMRDAATQILHQHRLDRLSIVGCFLSQVVQELEPGSRSADRTLSTYFAEMHSVA